MNAHDNRVLELFGNPVRLRANWNAILKRQQCPFANTKCFKVRKSQPDISIGTCAVRHGRDKKEIIICPNRLLERKQVFTDCLHLITLHEPGNELHIIPEVSIPGGSVDYFLVSAKRKKVMDFVAIEFQTLDTTGTVWPERQRLLRQFGVTVDDRDVQSSKRFGMNWKMTAKTILVQMHHKVETLEHIGKKLVLVVQDCLLDYLCREFNFAHLHDGRVGDSVHFHAYKMNDHERYVRIELVKRLSTDVSGVAECLGLQAERRIELETIIDALQRKMSQKTLLTLDAKPLRVARDMPAE